MPCRCRNNELTLSDVLDNMPLEQYVEIIGVDREVNGLDSLLESAAGRATALRQLPIEIRIQLLQRSNPGGMSGTGKRSGQKERQKGISAMQRKETPSRCVSWIATTATHGSYCYFPNVVPMYFLVSMDHLRGARSAARLRPTLMHLRALRLCQIVSRDSSGGVFISAVALERSASFEIDGQPSHYEFRSRNELDTYWSTLETVSTGVQRPVTKTKKEKNQTAMEGVSVAGFDKSLGLGSRCAK